MPPKTPTTNTLFQRLAQRAQAAHEKHKHDEVTYRANLPGGINGGVAQLRTAKLGEYAAGTRYAGQPYVILTGIASDPKIHDGIPVRGKRVSKTLPLCDQPDKMVTVGKSQRPRTFDDNWGAMIMELMRLGLEDAIRDGSPADLEEWLNYLGDTQPYYYFSTNLWTPPKRKPTDPDPTPMVLISFDGICDQPDTIPPTDDVGYAVQDEGGPDTGGQSETGTGTSSEPNHKDGMDSPSGKDERMVEPTFDDGATAQGGTTVVPSADDLDTLAEQAEEMDPTAQQTLIDMATAAGYSQEEIDSAEPWSMLAEMVRNPKSIKAATHTSTTTSSTLPTVHSPQKQGNGEPVKPTTTGKRPTKAMTGRGPR